MQNQFNLKPNKKYDFTKSLIAYIDILGFTNLFEEQPDLCIELLSMFAEYNGVHFDKVDNGQRQTRAAALCFSDNIGISIPAEINRESSPDGFYRPLFAILHAISLFAYTALSKVVLMRGAIAYGDVYQTEKVIAGMPYIEAVKHEKTANYPRFIVATSAIEEIKRFSETSPYGWNLQKIHNEIHLEIDGNDGSFYFNWLGFHKAQPESNHGNSKQSEIIKVITFAINQLCEEIKQTKDLGIKQKLFWMLRFLEKNKSKWPN